MGVMGGCCVVGCHWANGHVTANNVHTPQAGCHWLNGRVVLANEYINYIVKKTWHSNGGCHWAGVMWSAVTLPGVIDRVSLAGRPCRVGQRIYILYS
jgi:hypothetical protein